MVSSRKRFVLGFLAFGFTLRLVAKLVLQQSPQVLGATPDQQAWQRFASTLLWPLQVVLFGPIYWLQQDPDPPPPLQGLQCAVYWSLLALGLHYLVVSRNRARAG